MYQKKNIASAMESTKVSMLFRFRLIVLFITIPVIAAVLYLYSEYVFEPLVNMSPAALGLPSIFIFCILLLVFSFTPWEEISMLFNKNKPLEIKTIIETQVHERHEALSNIDERLTTLEEQIFNLDEVPFRSNPLNSTKLRELIIEFLTTHKNDPCSPDKIKEWGAKQEGFEQLKGYKLPQICEVLRELVTNKVLKVVVNKKGNTLYKMSNLIPTLSVRLEK